MHEYSAGSIVYRIKNNKRVTAKLDSQFLVDDPAD